MNRALGRSSSLCEEIGRLKVEVDWLKKTLMLPSVHRRGLIEPQSELSLRRQSQLLLLSRSLLYFEPARESRLNPELMKRIDELYAARPFYGSRRIRAELRGPGFQVNRKPVQGLMRMMGIAAVHPRARTAVTARKDKRC